MSSAPGTWDTGPAFTPARADFALAYDASQNKLYAMGGDADGGGFFDSTNLVNELDLSGWPGGTWDVLNTQLAIRPIARRTRQASLGRVTSGVWEAWTGQPSFSSLTC